MMGLYRRIFGLVFALLSISSCFGDGLLEIEVNGEDSSSIGGLDTECIHYHELDNDLQCTFIKETEDCQPTSGFFNYLTFSYCLFSANVQPLALIILFIWLTFLFVCLGVTAKNFFCPNLRTISRTLKLSDNVAHGVTFLAFGNGSPDIFSAVAAITNSKDGDAGLAIGALFGAATFITSFVAATVTAMGSFKVTPVTFLRDAIFVVGAAYWIFYILYTGEIWTAEAIGFILLYLGYVCIVLISGRFSKANVPVVVSVEDCSEDQEESFVKPQAEDRENSNKIASEKSEKQPLLLARNGTSSFGTIEPALKSSGEILSSDTAVSIPDTPEKSEEELAHEDYLQEEEPLLNKANDPSGFKQQLVALFRAINPIDVEGWKSKSYFLRFFEIYRSPIKLLLQITVPLILHEGNSWNKLLNCFQLLIGPVWCTFITRSYNTVIAGEFYLWELMLCIGAILAILVFFTSKPNTPPVYYRGLVFLGFIISVCWIFAIANEIVNLLRTFGMVFDLSDAILGLTFLAWGNCIGDLISDTAMARQGSPNMAISACFGGPVFNMLIGIGVATTIATTQSGGTFKLKTDTLQYVLACGLACSLFTSMFYMIAAGFRATKVYSGLMYAFYVTFLTVAILTETKVLKW